MIQDKNVLRLEEQGVTLNDDLIKIKNKIKKDVNSHHLSLMKKL